MRQKIAGGKYRNWKGVKVEWDEVMSRVDWIRWREEGGGEEQ
jgi:hypothetical protein